MLTAERVIELLGLPDQPRVVFVNGRHVLDGDRYDARAHAGEVLRL